MSRSRIDRSAPARRAVVRWAYRLAKRDRRQYTVIAVLLTIAVAASAFVTAAAYNLAPAGADAEFGTAGKALYLEGDDVTPAAIRDWVAAGVGSFGVVDPIGHRTIPVPGTTVSLDYRAQAIDGAYSAPMLTLREGRAPRAGTEAAITDGVASLLDVGIGDTVDADGTPRQVVGIVENPSDLNDEFVLLAPSELEHSQSVTMLFDSSETQLRHFGDQAGAIRLGQRADVPEDVLAGVLTLLASTVVLLLVGLISAASFTVIAQRRMPQYGMLSAIGGSERHIRLTVLASGTLIGLFAAVVGGAIGMSAWFVFSPVMEPLVNHRIEVANVPWLLIGAGMLLAILAATAAAWWPARAMSRIPTVSALSGRTPQQSRSHRSVVLAVVLAVGGAVCLRAGSNVHDVGPSALQTVLLVGGTLSVLVGVLLLCPIVIRALGKLATSLPVSGRLALRDLNRHQARSSAALAAIGLSLGIPAVIVASVAAEENASPLGNLASNQLVVHGSATFEGPFAPSPARVAEVRPGVDAIAATLDRAQTIELDAFVDPNVPRDPKSAEAMTANVARKTNDGWDFVGTVYAATPELLAAMGLDASDVAGGDVATSVAGDLDLLGVKGGADPQRLEGEPLAHVGTLPATYTSLPGSLLDPSAGEQHGWSVVPSGRWLIQTPHALNAADLQDAREIATQYGLRIETRDDNSNLHRIRLIAGLIGMVLALGVLAATLGLIRGESASDLRTLTATGARPSTRRGIAAATAGTLAAAGAAIGIASAYLGLTAGRVDHLTPLPWGDLAIIAIATPMLATLVAWVLGGKEPAQIARSPLD
jgi:putative ABC transport system permease protein